MPTIENELFLSRRAQINGAVPIGYSDFKSRRSKYNSEFDVVNEGGFKILTTFAGGKLLMASIETTLDSANLADYQDTLESLANKSLVPEERRFLTHNFADPATWDGRTNGDPAKTWAVAQGATDYNDVAYKWTNGATRVAWLDTSLSQPAWKDDAGNVVAHYQSSDKTWRRDDNSANVTSSRFSIVPYGGKKLEVRYINILTEKDAAISANGSLNLKIWSIIPESPTVPVIVRTATYKTMVDLRAAINLVPSQDNQIPAWALSQPMTLGFDYTRTSPFVLDSRYTQSVDIDLDNHTAISGVNQAIGGFICVNWDSF